MSPGESLRSIMGIGKPRFRRYDGMWECVVMKGERRCLSIGATPREAWVFFRVMYLPWSFWGAL